MRELSYLKKYSDRRTMISIMTYVNSLSYVLAESRGLWNNFTTYQNQEGQSIGQSASGFKGGRAYVEFFQHPRRTAAHLMAYCEYDSPYRHMWLELLKELLTTKLISQIGKAIFPSGVLYFMDFEVQKFLISAILNNIQY